MKGRTPKSLVGSTGMVELIYNGRANGTVSWWGPITGTQYKAGLKKPRIYVDSRDAEKALSDWQEQGVPVFSKAPTVRAPRPVQLPPEPPPVQEPELELEDELPFDDIEPEPEIVEIEATNGAIELAEEHGVDLSELWQGKKLSVYDVRRYIDDNTFDS